MHYKEKLIGSKDMKINKPLKRYFKSVAKILLHYYPNSLDKKTASRIAFSSVATAYLCRHEPLKSHPLSRFKKMRRPIAISVVD